MTPLTSAITLSNPRTSKEFYSMSSYRTARYHPQIFTIENELCYFTIGEVFYKLYSPVRATLR